MAFTLHLRRCLAFMGAIGLWACMATQATAASYEIKLYSDDLPEKGESEMEFLTSIAKSRSQKQVVQGLFEVSYGLTDQVSVGIELPASVVQGHAQGRGIKLEAQYIAKHAKEGFYWGIRSEFGSENSFYESEKKRSVEVNPILGYHGRDWQWVFNPSLEKDLTGDEQKPSWAPAFKWAYAVVPHHELGFETYMRSTASTTAFWPSASQRDQTTYLVWDVHYAHTQLNLGIGKPTPVSNSTQDHWVGKVGISMELD